ncbi:MAG: methyltransferase domain-containing protein [Isosphaeraceae bacterium]
MTPEALAPIRCPRCRSTGLRPRDPGRIACPACSAEFPVIDGVPRLAGESYVASFGRQWNRYDVMRPDEDEAVFRVKTGLDPASLRGQTVLDAGCGGGRYAALLGRHGARVIGVDLSDAVVKASALCQDYPDVTILQADLLDLPIADASVDVAFSIGVLHHSPDPRRAFAEVARCVRPGGRLAVWLYRRNTPPRNGSTRASGTHHPDARPGPGTDRRRPGDPGVHPGRQQIAQPPVQLFQPPRLDTPRLR